MSRRTRNAARILRRARAVERLLVGERSQQKLARWMKAIKELTHSISTSPTVDVSSRDLAALQTIVDQLRKEHPDADFHLNNATHDSVTVTMVPKLRGSSGVILEKEHGLEEQH